MFMDAFEAVEPLWFRADLSPTRSKDRIVETPGVIAHILAHRDRASGKPAAGAEFSSCAAGQVRGVTLPGERAQVDTTLCVGVTTAGRGVLRSTIGAPDSRVIFGC